MFHKKTNKVRNILKGQMVTGKLGTGARLRVGRLVQSLRKENEFFNSLPSNQKTNESSFKAHTLRK
jgi:hypothetical protein